MRSLRYVLVSAAILALAAPASSSAQSIPPGHDFLHTATGSSFFDFDPAANTGVPGSFFGSSCQQLDEIVFFGGVPLEQVGPPIAPPSSSVATGNTDTVVQRLGEANVPNDGNSDTVPIQLVELSLVGIEPVTVICGGQKTRWDVHVDLADPPSPPSQGQLTINRDSSQGGTFNSQLLVFPKFIFTRIGGNGQPRVFQAHDFNPPPEITDLIFTQEAPGTWSAPCRPPALFLPGLNELWCPGLTPPPDDEKVLTVEQAALAAHGFYPAQPALEHFKCYTSKPKRRPFQARSVNIENQLQKRNIRLNTRKELCNPVQKRQEPWLNRRAHQQCYAPAGKPKPVNARVAVQNQFGSQRLLVKAPKRLCLPTSKRKLPNGPRRPITPKTLIDHFTCYGVESRTPVRSSGRGKPNRIRLKDQFGRERVRVGGPKWLCAPTNKNNEGMDHPVTHLVCYRISDVRRGEKRVAINNQFERKRLKVRAPHKLCLPTNKLAL